MICSSSARSLGRGRDTSLPDTPRTDPHERSLAHAALIADDWRRSDPGGRDGARAVEEASDQPPHGIVHALAELLHNLPQLRPHALADRLAPHRESP